MLIAATPAARVNRRHRPLRQRLTGKRPRPDRLHGIRASAQPAAHAVGPKEHTPSMSPSRSRALTAVHDAGWRLQDAGLPVDAAFVHAADQPNAFARAIAVAGGAAPVDSTVLIVDDHAPNVALLEELLRSAGIDAVHGLTDGGAVVSRLLELCPDLVLLDLHMPHMDGLDVLAALRAAV